LKLEQAVYQVDDPALVPLLLRLLPDVSGGVDDLATVAAGITVRADS